MQPKNRGALVLVIVFVVIPIAIFIMVSSNNNKSQEDKTQTIDRSGSVETALSVIHADSTHDVILTTYKVWIRDTTYAAITHRDTVPALDSMTTEAGNNDGDTRSIRVKRDYQLFITVK